MAIDIPGVGNTDTIMAQVWPWLLMLGFSLAVLVLIGIVAYIIIQGRKANWLIYPWEWKWNIIIRRPIGKTFTWDLDRGADIQDGQIYKIKLERSNFNIPYPPKELVGPNYKLEGFSAGFRHFVPIKPNFIGYRLENLSEDMVMALQAKVKEINDVQAGISYAKKLKGTDKTDKIKQLEEMLAAKQNELSSLEKAFKDELTGMAVEYQPYIDINAQNTASQEAEKVAREFQTSKDLKELILIAGVIFLFIVNILITSGMVGDNNKTQQKYLETLAPAIDRQTAAMENTNTLLNRTLSLSHPETVTINVTGANR